jgi:glycosyltransferase involved in cell wall biosynthesis
VEAAVFDGAASGARAPFGAIARSEARRPTVSLVVPTLNEGPNLPTVLRAIPKIVTEVIVVDGGSNDGTAEIARTLRPDALVVVDRRPGKGRAMRTGFEHATCDIIMVIDADGSMDPAEIPAFIGALVAGCDVAKGSRFIQGGGTDDMNGLRRAGNRALRLTARLAFGGRYSDLCYGYMAFWRRVLPVFDGTADGFEIETFLNVRALAAGLHVTEVASFERRRLHGESNLRTFRDGLRVLRTIVRERRKLARQRGAHGVLRPAAGRPDVGAPATTEFITVD